MTEQELIKENYQLEYINYELPYFRITKHFRIRYHTFLKYWSCHYSILYGDGFFFNLRNYIAKNKKDAKRVLSLWIKNSTIKDIKENKDYKFYLENIGNDDLIKEVEAK